VIEAQTMKWSSLHPSISDLLQLFSRLNNPDHHIASQALRDLVILLGCVIAGVALLWVLAQTVASYWRTAPYLSLTKTDDQTANRVLDSKLPLCESIRHHLVEFPSRDGTASFSKRRTVEAAEVFSESELGPGFMFSRLILAIPSILTGLGVLGTFVGLALGLGSLDLSSTERIEEGIKPLIGSFTVAFSSSVWGVGLSLLFGFCEKFCEGRAIGRIREIQRRIDASFPRYVPEEAMSNLERTSRGTEELLKGLAVQIGNQMQVAVREGVAETLRQEIGNAAASVVEAIQQAFTGNAKGITETTATMLSDALVEELKKISTVVDQLKTDAASNRSVVTDAVNKLNAHDSAMKSFADVTERMSKVADAFGAMKETLETSASRNQDASASQLAAAQSNEKVAAQFDRIGERLPESRKALEDAAAVIATITGPILGLKDVIDKLPTVTGDTISEIEKQTKNRDENLLRQTNDLADKVTIAANEFAKVKGLAEQLANSAKSLEEASNELAVFGQQVLQASQDQRQASEASKNAAASGERTAKALEPLPDKISALTGGLEAAGTSVRTGAEAAQASYRELISLQKQWFDGAKAALNAMRDSLEQVFKTYDKQVEDQTRNLATNWTDAVNECLATYRNQVERIEGGLDDLQAALGKFSS
jgi:hypothetical protein